MKVCFDGEHSPTARTGHMDSRGLITLGTRRGRMDVSIGRFPELKRELFSILQHLGRPHHTPHHTPPFLHESYVWCDIDWFGGSSHSSQSELGRYFRISPTSGGVRRRRDASSRAQQSWAAKCPKGREIDTPRPDINRGRWVQRAHSAI